MREDEFDIGYRLLDSDLIDSDGRRCGKVDDIAFDGGPGDSPRIESILVGVGAVSPRLRGPLGRAIRRLAGDDVVEVPWDAVDDVTAVVGLNTTAGELGLGRGDDRIGEIVGRVPGS